MNSSNRAYGAVPAAALTGVTAFFTLTQVATLAVGIVGARFGASTAASIALLSAAFATALGLAHLRHAPAASRYELLLRRPGIPRRITLTAVVTTATLVWAASMWVRLWVLALRRPPYDWDGLYYHLPALNAWVVKGAVTWTDMPDVPWVNNPMGIEAFTFLVHHLLPGTSVTSALNLWYWPIGVLAVVVIAIEVGARGPWPWLAGALLAGVPVVVCQSATAYIDPAFAFLVMGTVAAVLRFLRSDDSASWPATVLLGMSLGLMAGAKGTGAPFALVLLLGTGAAAAVLRRGLPLPQVFRALGVAAAIMASVGGYWYVRNTIHTGNPTYPVGLRLGSFVLSEGYDPVAMNEGNLPERLRRIPSLLRAPAAWLQQDAPIQGAAPVGGLGYLWIAFGVPAILAAAMLTLGGVGWSHTTFALLDRRNASAASARAYLALLLLVGVLFAIHPVPWWSRFTIWLHALGLPALALCLQWLIRDGAWIRRSLGALVLLALVGVSVWESERSLRIEWQRGRVPPSQATLDQPYLPTIDALFPGLASAAGFDRLLAADRLARSPWSRIGMLLGGVLAMPLGARELHVVPRNPTAADLDRINARGVRWLLWDEVAAGPVPSVITERTAESHIWSHGADSVFHAIRLADAR